MSLILHLSDLHLGTPSGWQLDYTDRFGLTPDAAGETKIDHLRRTLGALGEELTNAGRMLDAIVVSGDLTNANAPDGPAAFGTMLDELGEAKPANDRIVVVPGNHDTDWSEQPGKAAKFKHFLDLVRRPYRSPLIFGLDYDGATLERRTGSRPKARPILDLDDAVVVALSSADFCGVQEGRTKSPWSDIVAAYRAGDTSEDAKAARKRATDELRSLRVHDMARVHKYQLDALKMRLDTLPTWRDADLDARVRIAVLHHPIGPMAGVEEVKSFEALTNLEQVRSFLYFNGFHVVLHGHKHESYLGWDWLLPAGNELDAIPRRMLVVGSPGDFLPGQTVCRLLDTRPDDDHPVAGAPRLCVIDVAGIRTSQAVQVDIKKPSMSLAQPFVRSDDIGTPWVVRARTADAAYQQLRDLPTDYAIPRPVVSVVEDAASARVLPVNYPEAKDSRWLESVVEWWQHPRPEAVRAFAGSDFNHGERLYGAEDAIRLAALALPSSKAIAMLIRADEAGRRERDFPSLTAVQLHVRPAPDKGMLLDAVGIYRKQDLLLWWPVNMAELAYIQDRALAVAADNPNLDKPVVAGRLVAMAAIGMHDTVLPEMAGTALDRAVDVRPDWPHRLAYLAAQPRADAQAEWTEALADVGKETENDVLVPSIGLEQLQAALAMHRDLGDARPKFRSVVKAVDGLAKHSTAARGALRRDLQSDERTYWADTLKTAVQEVLRAVKAVATDAGAPWA
jgi:3',5'-cyclic AMP phosphodiesterase CpdA